MSLVVTLTGVLLHENSQKTFTFFIYIFKMLHGITEFGVSVRKAVLEGSSEETETLVSTHFPFPPKTSIFEEFAKNFNLKWMSECKESDYQAFSDCLSTWTRHGLLRQYKDLSKDRAPEDRHGFLLESPSELEQMRKRGEIVELYRLEIDMTPVLFPEVTSVAPRYFVYSETGYRLKYLLQKEVNPTLRYQPRLLRECLSSFNPLIVDFVIKNSHFFMDTFLKGIVPADKSVFRDMLSFNLLVEVVPEDQYYLRLSKNLEIIDVPLFEVKQLIDNLCFKYYKNQVPHSHRNEVVLDPDLAYCPMELVLDNIWKAHSDTRREQPKPPRYVDGSSLKSINSALEYYETYPPKKGGRMEHIVNMLKERKQSIEQKLNGEPVIDTDLD